MKTLKNTFKVSDDSGFWAGLILFIITLIVTFYYTDYTMPLESILKKFFICGVVLSALGIWTFKKRKVLFDRDNIYMQQYLTGKFRVVKYEDFRLVRCSKYFFRGLYFYSYYYEGKKYRGFLSVIWMDESVNMLTYFFVQKGLDPTAHIER